jgi:hypothetical protein
MVLLEFETLEFREFAMLNSVSKLVLDMNRWLKVASVSLDAKSKPKIQKF